MGFLKFIYIIPILLFLNTIFIFNLHSTYLGAIEDLSKQRAALEDVQYHLENNPNIEKQKEIEQVHTVFNNWWKNDPIDSDNSSTILLIGIPAVPRPQRYLSNTLAAVVEQLPSNSPDVESPWRNALQIHIINNKPGEDFSEFYELKEKYSTVPELVFRENSEPQTDRYADQPDPNDYDNKDDRPGKRVRRQTLDLISLMKLVEGKSKYFMFMEDDFPFCPKALDTFYYIIRKMGYYMPDWKAVRTSYGMNGIFIKGKEVKGLASYFNENLSHRPPDGLVVEWMCNKYNPTMEGCEWPQRHFTYRWNLFRHIGAVSSLRETGLPKFPGCWEFYSHLLWAIDGFNLNQCEDDDIWPCQNRPFIDSMHKHLDVDGWGYLNGYMTVTEQDGEIDVNLRQRSLQLIYSGPSSTSSLSPSLFLSIISFCFCLVFLSWFS